MSNITHQFLNQIFYKHNKFDKLHSLNLLEPTFYNFEKKMEFMKKMNSDLDIDHEYVMNLPDNKHEYLANSNTNSPTIKIETNPIVNVTPTMKKDTTPTFVERSGPTFVEPNQGDTLFWCVYMAVHGIAEYEQISRNYGIAELNEKQKISEFITKNPNAFKDTNMKLTKVALKEVMSDFMTNQKSLSFQSLIVLSVFYQRPIYIINKQKSIYLPFLPNIHDENKDERQIIYIYVNSERRGKYKWISTQDIKTIESTMFAMEHYDHALKSISQYKIDELKHIQQKLNIQIDESVKKPKKQDIYNAILQYSTLM